MPSDRGGYLGPASQFIDRTLATHQARLGGAASARRGSDRAARLAYELSGPEQSPVLVLSNSMGTTPAMWDQQLAALTGRLRVLRYDHRGHGASEAPPGPYRVEELGRDLLGLLDDLGLERVSFCGLSLGGMVGMWLAAHAPDRIDRLALCCTAATVNSKVYLERAAKVRAGGTGSVVAEVVDRWFTPAFRRAAAPHQVERPWPCCWPPPKKGTPAAARPSRTWTSGLGSPPSLPRRWSSRGLTTWPLRRSGLRRSSPRSQGPPRGGRRGCPSGQYRAATAGHLAAPRPLH